MYEIIKPAQEASVETVKQEKLVKPRPVGLNTVKMLKVASKTYGMSAHDTMHIAEHLYLRGFITYPRTESTTFSENFDFKEILVAHAGHPDWGWYSSQLLRQGFNTPKKGVDAGDHPPITPIKAATDQDLKDRDWKLYNFIARNFMACISQDATYDVIKVGWKVGREDFKLKGSTLAKPGFLDVMPWLGIEDDYIPLFKKGQVL